MSKIYEALQRAEQERLAGRPQPPAPPIAPAPDEPLAPIEWLAPPPHQPAGYIQPAPPVQTLDMVPEPAPLDLDSIPVSVWKPVLVKLPAIEERGGAVEQFRSLRTRLFAFRDLNKLKTVMVGSGSPREGKSFIACNLAISLARHKASRVLLIDGDMRRGTLHTLLGCSRTPGLTTYLTGAASATDVMQRAQLRDDGSPLSEGLSSVTFIGCGDGGDQAADLSGSPRFQQLIDTVSASFDWIVVDSSPVNLVADGVNLANACDGVVLVVRGGVTRFEMAQRALVELKASRVLGVVLNAVETPPSVDDYYGYVSEEKPAAAPGPATQ